MAFALGILFILLATSSETRKIYDLTHTMTFTMPTPPGGRIPFNQARSTTRIIRFGSTPEQAFCSLENAGTHLSAPFATNDARQQMHQIPLDNLLAPLVIIRFDTKEKSGRYVQKSDIENWEREHDKSIPEGSVVVLDSDWSDKWHDVDSYLPKFAEKVGFFPGFHLGACHYLISKRVVGIGIDTMAIDGGENAAKYKRPCQNLLSDSDIFVLENLRELRNIPDEEAMIFIGALKLTNGTGSPARILAYVESNGGTHYSGGVWGLYSWWALVSLCGFIAVNF